MTQELRKRSFEHVDELLNQASNEVNYDSNKRVRRHEYSAMTQYSSMPNSRVDTEADAALGRRVDCAHRDIGLISPPPGYIKKLTLHNFMCHRNFDVELGPGLNFIVGKNGSGKSAILTAITIGLGAKASETNRGSSLKDLITAGCNSSRITIYLSNSGIGAYVPKGKQYGDTIIIERTISRTSTAGFSLKSENGTEISNKKRDLQEILDYFAIPISNPMCFLSQDSARSFLTASTPTDKYNHFVKGTLLQQIKDYLERATEVHNESAAAMELHTESLRELQERYDKAKTDLRQISKTSDLNERLKLLTGKSLWLNVDENVMNINKLKNKISHYENEISKRTEKSDSRMNQIDSLKSEITIIEQGLSGKLSKMVEKEEQFQLMNEKIREAKSKYEQEENNEKEILDNIERCKSIIKKLNKSISELQEKQEKEQGGDKDNMLQEIEKLTASNSELKKDIEAYMTKIQDINAKLRTVKMESVKTIDSIDTQIREKQNEVKDIKHGRTNFLRNFDNNMEHLIKEISNNKSKFDNLPIGPLGNYVSIKSGYEKWAPSIQRYMTTTLSSFVVSSHRDNGLLRQLMKKCNVRSSNFSIINYKLQNAHFFDNNKLNQKYPTILDALDFIDGNLAAVFVDMNKIDRVLLIENMSEARKFLLENGGDTKVALSIRDNNYGYQLTGGTRIDSVKYQDKIRVKVGTSSEDNIAYINTVIRNLQEEKQSTQSRYKDRLQIINNELKECETALVHTKDTYRANNEKIKSFKTNITREVDTGKLNMQIEEKKNQEVAVESYLEARKSIQLHLADMVEDIKPLQEQYMIYKNELDQSKTEIENDRELLRRSKDKILKYQDHIKELLESVKNIEKNIPKIADNIRVLEDGVGLQKQKAQEICPRAELSNDLPHSQEEIKQEITNIQQKLQEAEKMMGMSQQQIVDNYNNAKTKFIDASKKYKVIEEVLGKLTRTIKIREQNLERTQQITFFEADNDFKASMRIRKFAGHLDFDKKEKKLSILILTPNDDRYREVSTFSGGEKSYSQMALLLATWRPMRSRIIALDEFDVFMDQVNRKIGSKLIVKKLKDIPNTQTIIITPQDIGGIAEIDDSVRILRMRDPKRTTIN